MKKVFSKIADYFSGVKKELGRIRWTKPKDLLRYSVSTLSFMIFFGIFFTVIDLVITFLRSI